MNGSIWIGLGCLLVIGALVNHNFHKKAIKALDGEETPNWFFFRGLVTILLGAGGLIAIILNADLFTMGMPVVIAGACIGIYDRSWQKKDGSRGRAISLIGVLIAIFHLIFA